MITDLHPIQAVILRELLFHNGTNFTSLNKSPLTSDHFNFHVQKLITSGLIEKSGKLYFLTQKGKTFASKLDIDSLKLEKQGSPSVAVTAKKLIHGQVHYLVHQRLKEPFYGYFGFINGKIRFGEFSETTAKREMKEETGLSGQPKILAVTHKLRGPNQQEIKLDHFFFLYLVFNPSGKLKNTKEGNNFWKPMAEIRTLKTFPGFAYYLDAIESETFTPYLEHFIKVDEI